MQVLTARARAPSESAGDGAAADNVEPGGRRRTKFLAELPVLSELPAVSDLPAAKNAPMGEDADVGAGLDRAILISQLKDHGVRKSVVASHSKEFSAGARRSTVFSSGTRRSVLSSAGARRSTVGARRSTVLCVEVGSENREKKVRRISSLGAPSLVDSSSGRALSSPLDSARGGEASALVERYDTVFYSDFFQPKIELYRARSRLYRHQYFK